MTKMNTSRIDRRQKQKDRSRKNYGSQKHIRVQEEIQRRKREKQNKQASSNKK